MTTFATHTKETAPAAAKNLLEAAQGKFGFIPNLLGKVAEAPNVLKVYLDAFEATSQGSLSIIEQKIVQIETSRANACEYCVAADSTISDKLKLPSDIIDAVREGRPLPDKKLEALRQFTNTIVSKQGWASDAEVAGFLAAGYTNAQALEVVLSITVKILGNYANHLVKSPLDKAFEPRAIKIAADCTANCKAR